MRTKTLLLTAALVAAGVASSMAQSNVYSVNIVGYVNIPVAPTTFYLLGNPLDTGNGNVVTNVLNYTTPQNDNLDQSLIYSFDPIAGLTVIEEYFAGFGWFPGTNVLKPGSGFYFYDANTTTNLTFVGNVTLTNNTSLPVGTSLTASAYPASISLAALGLTNAQDQDIVFRYGGGGLSDLVEYFGGYGWFETTNGNAVAGGTGGSTNGPNLNVGEAFFYFNANENSQGPEAWNQAFTVN